VKDWKAIALANGLEVPGEEMERIVGPLTALEKTFRPLIKDLPPGLEPASGFAAQEEID
jgi:hypothetical protein